MNHCIGAGSRIVLHYWLRLEDGTVADTSEQDAPLDFRLGDGTLVEGLERPLLGLCAGQRKSFVLGPGDTFGFRDPDNVHLMPRVEFPSDMELEPGAILGFSGPDGEELPGTVLRVEDDVVALDFNHPFAGHTLTFEVEILDVQPD